MYSLRRHGDNAGLEAPRSQFFMRMPLEYSEEGRMKLEEDGIRPKVGGVMLVSSTSRWYRTSIVTEIIEESPYLVIFRTLNSVYTWEQY